MNFILTDSSGIFQGRRMAAFTMIWKKTACAHPPQRLRGQHITIRLGHPPTYVVMIQYG